MDRLVYRSNALGSDLALTNAGGGNTSSKLMEADPLTGERVEVLWVKGSGGDLRTAKRDGFASLYADRVRATKPRYLAHPGRGPKTAIEDEMYETYRHCVFDLNPRACSIDRRDRSISASASNVADSERRRLPAWRRQLRPALPAG